MLVFCYRDGVTQVQAEIAPAGDGNLVSVSAGLDEAIADFQRLLLVVARVVTTDVAEVTALPNTEALPSVGILIDDLDHLTVHRAVDPVVEALIAFRECELYAGVGFRCFQSIKLTPWVCNLHAHRCIRGSCLFRCGTGFRHCGFHPCATIHFHRALIRIRCCFCGYLRFIFHCGDARICAGFHPRGPSHRSCACRILIGTGGCSFGFTIDRPRPICSTGNECDRCHRVTCFFCLHIRSESDHKDRSGSDDSHRLPAASLRLHIEDLRLRMVIFIRHVRFRFLDGRVLHRHDRLRLHSFFRSRAVFCISRGSLRDITIIDLRHRVQELPRLFFSCQHEMPSFSNSAMSCARMRLRVILTLLSVKP